MSPLEGMRDAMQFMTRQARTRVCGLGPQQARQEALCIAQIRSQIGIVAKPSFAAVPERLPVDGEPETGVTTTSPPRAAGLPQDDGQDD